MIKVIFWDFDGVILDSMKIKGDGFLELFKNFDFNLVKILENYHYENGGVSRFDKIRFFYEDILKVEISQKKINFLADEFSLIMKKNLFDKSKLIQDSLHYIKNNYKKYNFHIVSGAENFELNELCDYFEISNFFKSIDGSPTKKEILINNVMNKNNYNKNETILIGDADNDYYAAKKNDIKFYGYNNLDLKKFGNYIYKLKNVKL